MEIFSVTKKRNTLVFKAIEDRKIFVGTLPINKIGKGKPKWELLV
mgnify:CR=1 FL=1